MTSYEEEYGHLRQWIASLAFTIACCAVFFLFFSNHYMNMRKQLNIAEIRTDMLEAKVNFLESSLVRSVSKKGGVSIDLQITPNIQQGEGAPIMNPHPLPKIHPQSPRNSAH